MKDVRTNLVYYFYGDKNFASNRANKIHFNCLKHYSDRFDRSDFYISVDDVNDIDLIKDIECAIIRCGYISAAFHIIENGSYRESKVLYDGVIDKVGVTEGITFFAHNKGITNYNDYSAECIDSWICGLYYLSLEDMEDVYGRTVNTFFPCTFYGSFLMEKENFDKVRGISSVKTYYAGSYYWINNAELYNRYERNGVKLVGRYSAECYPYDLCKDHEVELTCYRLIKIKDFDFYTISCLGMLHQILESDKYRLFYDFYQKMLLFN